MNVGVGVGVMLYSYLPPSSFLPPSLLYICLTLYLYSLPLVTCHQSSPISLITSHFTMPPLFSLPTLCNNSTNSDSLSNPSFLLWLVTVTIIPVLTYMAFEEHWAPYAGAALGILDHLRVGSGLEIVR